MFSYKEFRENSNRYEDEIKDTRKRTESEMENKKKREKEELNEKYSDLYETEEMAISEANKIIKNFYDNPEKKNIPEILCVSYTTMDKIILDHKNRGLKNIGYEVILSVVGGMGDYYHRYNWKKAHMYNFHINMDNRYFFQKIWDPVSY